MPADSEIPVLVYDVGGSHVSAAVCLDRDLRLGPVVAAPHPIEQTSSAFVQLLYSLGMEACAVSGSVSGAELAVPGPFDFSAGVSLMQHKLRCLYGIDLRRELARAFGWQPSQVRFLHDAAAFLLGEMGAGAARGVQRAAGITLGTGIGSALANGGHVVTEGPGVPPGGEIWNLPYEGGIVEDFISTRAIKREFKHRTGIETDVASIAAAAGNDPNAAAAFTVFGSHLGLALRMTLANFAPEVVVIGGGIARSAHLFLPAALRELEGLELQLRISALKDHAALVGAAVAWFNNSGSVNDSSSHSTATHVDAV
jgi:glucokinase